MTIQFDAAVANTIDHLVDDAMVDHDELRDAIGEIDLAPQIAECMRNINLACYGDNNSTIRVLRAVSDMQKKLTNYFDNEKSYLVNRDPVAYGIYEDPV